jgi:hypothetical protein
LSGEEDEREQGPRRRKRCAADGVDVAEGGCCLLEVGSAITVLAAVLALPAWLFLT